MSAQNNTENPATVPQPFAGYHVQIEYTDGLPAAGSLFAAVRTPQGLTLAFLRLLPGGRIRLDAFDHDARPLYFKASEIEVIGPVVLTPRTTAERRAI
jgi:hypothetical protein